ncbi:MAG TPA: DUF72 domain-containing protein [Acidobacteriaceae bacterium]|nr:DUF72 domain-containing protein [Acidobacteriaceae bacterium]
MHSHPHNVYAGTSGWAYASWKPGFYPAKTPAARMLAYYASQLNSVEVNFTFRQLPTEKQLTTWLDAATEGFRFSFKAPQAITHLKRLRECGDALAALKSALLPAERAGKLGAVLFQLPPNFRADTERLKSFLDDLTRLKLRAAFEFRHESWFEEPTYAALEQGHAALCIAESDELQTPQRRTADFICYRLRRSSYSEAELQELARRFAEDAEDGDVYAYFMHEDAPDGPLRARAVLEALAQ